MSSNGVTDAPASELPVLIEAAINGGTTKDRNPNVPVTPQWGLSKLDQSQAAPAGLVLWDYGTPTSPTTNLAPNGAAYGADPHGFGRGNALLLDQITTFLATGVIPNECGAAACQSNTP